MEEIQTQEMGWRRTIRILTSPKDSTTPMEIIEVTVNSILENAFRTNSQ